MRTRVQFSDAASDAIAKVAAFHGLSDNAAIQLLCSTYAPLHLEVAKGVVVELDSWSRPTLMAIPAQNGHVSTEPMAIPAQSGHQRGHSGPERPRADRDQQGAVRGLKSLRSILK